MVAKVKAVIMEQAWRKKNDLKTCGRIIKLRWENTTYTFVVNFKTMVLKLP